MVTRHKRRVILRARKAKAAEDRAGNRSRRSSAWSRVIQGIRANREKLPVTPSITLPFSVHPTHECVGCGGFVGCVVCGSVISRSRKGQRLVDLCRPPAGPRSSGSFTRVRRLAQGLHPRSRFSNWPDGNMHPRPFRVVIRHSEDFLESVVTRWRRFSVGLLAQEASLDPLLPRPSLALG